ncbi:MAG TPA: 3'-5' exonuclease, partial [Smithellaceae bacterium]|nr:3'-5' exonuclease [Smithellaceae bacterium]
GDIEILLPLIDEILSGPGERGERSFFAVGDWKQMIYGWRGADRDALESAIGSYIANNIITESSLEYNYRSTPLLISFFNELIGNLFAAPEKGEIQKPPEESISFSGVSEVNLVELEKEGYSQDAFYSTIVEYLKNKKNEYSCSWGDIAVLALTNNHVRKVETELIKNGIRVATVKGRQLLSTEEGLAVMLFLAGVLAKDDETGFIPAVEASPLWKEIFGDIEILRADFLQKYPRPFGLAAVSRAIELLREKLPAVILDIWQDEAQAFFSEGGVDADGFLQRMFNIRLSVKVPEAGQSENIKVDTIHGTKGLQFRHVFVFWNEDEKGEPFYMEAQKCHGQFCADELKFLSAAESPIAREIIRNYEINQQRLRREMANVFYVAATRAIQTLTVFMPKKKDEENIKPVHQAVLSTFSRFAPEGGKKEIYHSSVIHEESEPVTIYNVPVRHNNEPEKYGEIDPTLLSSNIKAGIMRGERLHRWLAKVIDKDKLPPAGELSDEEYKTAIGFVQRNDVAALMFRPGKIYIEQQISDKNNFGIVDRMIVAGNLITIIDYKSGSLRRFRQKYEEQLERYTGIMKALYPQKNVEYYILPVDI